MSLPIMDLEDLNSAAPEEAKRLLLACCGSQKWAERMLEARPFADLDSLEQAADRSWRELAPDDWREAFAAHAKIGEGKTADAGSSASAGPSARWSHEEQAGARRAESEVLAALAAANRAYEERFGYIFIVCATGKSGREMLALCRERLAHDRQTELQVASGEQAKITRLRLRKLLGARK